MKNYIRYAFGLTLMVTLFTIGLRYIPEQTVFGMKLKRTDILSDLNRGNDIEDLDGLVGEDQAGTVPEDGTTATPADSTGTAPVQTTQTTRPTQTPADPPKGSVIPIVDYSEGGWMLSSFVNKLHQIDQGDRPLRIAFMGDSFIEGDLVTGDLRELLQTKYGGGGVGFVPITSQVAGFRMTVAHKYGDWKQKSIAYSDKGFTISGYYYIPSEGAYADYKSSVHKKHLDRFDRARLLYISRGTSTLKAQVNGSQEFTRTTEPSEALQEWVLEGDIQSIRYTVNGVEGFTGYGAFLENKWGINVDNYSMRGNSGMVMTKINRELSDQLDQIAPNDLIVLQYGLNVVESDVTNYSGYGDQMTLAVNHLKECFPHAAILIMSVPDRGTRVNGELVTMPGVRAMVKVQQKVAQECGVLYWSTFDLMRSLGGMATFVKNNWAAKDYTHIGARGGAKVAAGLYEAILAADSQ